MDKALLKMENIYKSFSKVKVLKGVDFTLKEGKVMALVGENGAGKSTLMRILTGIYNFDDGQIWYKGESVKFANAMQAKMAGIAIIHQELNLFQNLSAAENIFIGDKSILKNNLVNWKEMENRAQDIVDSIGGKFSVTTIVKNLSVQNQQIVEIAKSLAANAQIIIMDEPTSALPEHEVQNLFNTIRGLKARNVAIVYVSHRLNEIFEICDEITVLRDGITTYVDELKNMTPTQVVEQMIGKEVEELYPKLDVKPKDIVFEAHNLNDGDTLKNVSFSVREGEILGLYGLIGSGATECPNVIFGLEKYNGKIIMNGEEIKVKSPQDAIRHKIAYVPPDRRRQGVIYKLTLKFNMSLAVINKLCKNTFISSKKEKKIASEYIKLLNIKCYDETQIINELSGGNQQKVVIAKWLALNPKLLILNDPTRGVDVGAKAEIYALISQLAKDGMAIILTSCELGEILGMSDRILVLNEGCVKKEFMRNEANQKILLKAATVQGNENGGQAI